MIKVLLCAPCPPPRGGIATWVDELLLGFENNPEVEVSICDTANKKRPAGSYGILRRLIDGFSSIFSQFFQLIDFLTKNKFDLVHIASSGGLSHFRDILYILASKIFRAKVVLHLHFGCADDSYKWFPISKTLLKCCIKFADEVYCLDEKIAKLFKLKKFKVVRNGMRLNSHKKVSQKFKTITFVGWIIEQKGIFDLLDAWNLIDEKVGWKINVIGPASNENKKRLEEYVSTDVHYLGELERDDVLRCLADSYIFALPSHTEGFPYAVLEAMSAGCCLFVSDVGGINALFNKGSKLGVMIEPKKVLEMKYALKSLISNLDEVKLMSENSKEIYRNSFTEQDMADEILTAWTNLVDYKYHEKK